MMRLSMLLVKISIDIKSFSSRSGAIGTAFNLSSRWSIADSRLSFEDFIQDKNPSRSLKPDELIPLVLAVLRRQATSAFPLAAKRYVIV